MKILLICGWLDRSRKEILDVADHLGFELIRRNIAISLESGIQFSIDENYWEYKDAKWNSLIEKS